jgi:hypothetical protein
LPYIQKKKKKYYLTIIFLENRTSSAFRVNDITPKADKNLKRVSRVQRISFFFTEHAQKELFYTQQFFKKEE